ncbi:bacillithiol system redox-active protein YtxJ [Wandonia haliotis]|uniref:Bacillithiol system redox-active protein YtxJ n=1 Tax=Wandonia haliotis TaxID=574963 RepID=A0ABP3XX80_9FLAO
MGLFSFGKKQDQSKKSITWIQIEDPEQLQEIIRNSSQQPILFFKHSTRCSISAMALHGLEKSWDLEEGEVTPYFIDLIRFRDVSNKIEELTGVLHQSPQVIVIKNGEVIHQASHNGIKASQIKKAVQA